MPLFSRNKITVNHTGAITITGRFAKHAAKLEHFIQELGAREFTITLRKNRYEFAGKLDPQHKQRLRNFLVNECPLP